jgi:lysophospholipase L1-like esterase
MRRIRYFALMNKFNSIFLFFFISIWVFAVLSFTLYAQKTSDIHLQDKNSTYSYLALGDSYTICESVDESERWPNILSDRLIEKGMIIRSTEIIARTGWRTDNMLTAAKKLLEKDQKFDMVSLLIGVNNEFQGKSPEEFKPEFEKCLSYAIQKSKEGVNGVFVVSIPDYGYTPFGKKNQKSISKRLDAYNEICEESCSAKNVAFYNITSISRSDLNDKTLVAKDGLHPSGKQYGLWVDSFINSVFKLFNP